jgi:hypothetical protein
MDIVIAKENFKNLNGRIYPKGVFEKAIKENQYSLIYNEDFITENGTEGKSISGEVVGVVKPYVNEDGDIIAAITINDKQIKDKIEKCECFVCSSGYGDVNGNGVIESCVIDKFYLALRSSYEEIYRILPEEPKQLEFEF